MTEDQSATALEAVFEWLPAMSMIERHGIIVARNAIARQLTGFGSGVAAGLTTRREEVLPGSCHLEETGDDGEQQRSRFDCLAIRRNAPPMPVSVVAQNVWFGGGACRLLMMTERCEGFGGASDGDGSFLEDVLDATPEATVIAHEGRVLHVNRAFTEMFGFSLRESVGEELDALIVPEGRMHESEMLLYQLRGTGKSGMETRRCTRAGAEVYVSVNVSRVRLGGAAIGMFCTYRDIGAEKREQARLHYTSLHDGLTGLANRALFMDRVEQTMARLRRRPDRGFAIVFLDLDGFKQVNDRLGHAAGDALLQEAGERLLRCVRPQDTVARFGGDEFALLLDESSDEREVDGVVDRIQAEICRPIVLGGREAKVSASMGVAMAKESHLSGEEIVGEADRAMYEAKAAGKGRHVVFGQRRETVRSV